MRFCLSWVGIMDVTKKSWLAFAACCVFLIGVECVAGDSTSSSALDALVFAPAARGLMRSDRKIKCKSDPCLTDEACYEERSNNVRKLMCTSCKDRDCGSARLAETWVSFNSTSVQGRGLMNSEVTIICPGVEGLITCWGCSFGPDGSITCQCPDTIVNSDCVLSRPCTSISCLNGGTCGRSPSEREECSCRNGYHGDQCQFSACSHRPCMNGGICNPHETSDGLYTFTCTCPPLWTGQVCETTFLPSVCIPNKCAEGCQCKPSCKHEGGYFCYGNNGKVGKHCNLTAPNITCGANEIKIEVDEDLVKDYMGGFSNVEVLASQSPTKWHPSITWPPNACHASKKGKKYVFVVPLPFSACGTKLYMSGAAGVTVASNTIWFNQYTANGLAYITIPVVNFTCHYQKQYSIITSISPELAPPRVIQVTGKYRGNVTMELCKVNDYCPLASCPQKYSLSNGAIYTVGEELYLRILPVAQGFQVRLTQLFLSCSSKPTVPSASNVILLTVSCIYGKPVGPYHASKYSRYGNGIYCVSFKVPMLAACNSTFYIHAHLQTCATNCNDPYNTCEYRGRRRRSADKDVESAMQTYGPIIVLNGKDGVLASTVYPGDEEMEAFDKTLLNKGESGFDTESSKTATLSTALSVLIVVAAVLSVLIAYSWRFVGGSRQP